MKHKFKKLLAGLLVATMLTSIVPIPSIYATADTSAATSAAEESTADTSAETTAAETTAAETTAAETPTTDPAPVVTPASPVDENIIDYSHPTLKGYGFTFGVSNNETRWQTFTATKTGMMDAVEVVLLKKNAQTVATPDVTAYLYSVENNLPATLLAQTTVIGANLKSATPGAAVLDDMISRFPLQYTLQAGTQYAIVLASAVVGTSGATDQCYDWFTANLGKTGVEFFGKSDGSTWVDESGLGTAWLKVFYAEQEVVPDPIDFTFPSTGNGYGFGATGNEYRWQTFTATEGGNLGSVDLQLTKFAHNADSNIDQIGDLIVELRTVVNNKPDALLLRTMVSADDITSKVPFNVPLAYTLEAGATYAIALTMARPFSAHGGYDCYGWTTSQHPNAVGQFFGKTNTTQDQNYAGDAFNWADESFLGAGWLKVNFASNNPGPETPKATTVLATITKSILDIAATSQITATVKDQLGAVMSGAVVTYSSSNPAVVTVSATGEVTGVAEGTASIEVASGEAKTTLAVTVRGADGTVIPVPGMVIDQDIILKPGEYDFDGAAKGLVVTGSNITIDGTGVIIRNAPLEDTTADVTSGAYALALNAVAGQTEYDLTRQFPLSTASDIKLSLDAKATAFAGELKVLVSTDNKASWNTVLTTAVTANWTKYTADLSSYSGQTVYVRLSYSNATAVPDDMYLKLDTVELFENGVRTFSDLFESKPFYWWDISYGDGVRVADAMRNKPFDRTTYEVNKSQFKGIGLTADGLNNVTIKGLTISGFAQAMSIANSSALTIQNNNLSNNFTDPNGGWGNQTGGGLLLNNVNNSTITNNIANNNADGLLMRYSNHNTITDNDFSVCSDVALEMTNASFNQIENNNFSWGVRIDAYEEVHARDSTSQLMESGSNYNNFLKNDFTHGGDGIFIRVLNGWSCEGNYFIENDTSFANNNAVESWAGRNYYIRNKANYSSYGFWLGGSDESVLYGNEAAYNGISPHNAPEAFGNAGIAIVNGTGEHIKIENNNIHDNYGPGIALRYKSTYPTHHYIIQNNRITNNKTSPYSASHVGYAIYLDAADWLDIAGNFIEGNSSNTVFKSSTVTNVFERTSPYYDTAAAYEANVPTAKLVADKTQFVVGEEITFSAAGSTDPNSKPLSYRWDMGDGTIMSGNTVKFTFDKPGYYDVAVTTTNGQLSDLAWLNCNVVAAGPEIGTESNVADWLITENNGKTVASNATPAPGPLTPDVDFYTYFVIDGATSIHIDSTSANNKLTYPKTKDGAFDFSQAGALTFSAKVLNEGNDFSSYKTPVVRIGTDENNFVKYTPVKSWLSPVNAADYMCGQYRSDWIPFVIPFAGNNEWAVTTQGTVDFSHINFIEIDAGTGGDGLHLWLDGLKTLPIDAQGYYANLAIEGTASASSTVAGSTVTAPITNSPAVNAFWQSEVEAQSVYTVDLGTMRNVTQLDFYYRYIPTGDESIDVVGIPTAYHVEYMNDNGQWVAVPNAVTKTVRPNKNTATFDLVSAKGLRLVIDNAAGKASSLYGVKIFNTQNYAAQLTEDSKPMTQVASSIIKNATLSSVEMLALVNNTLLWPDKYGDLEAYIYAASADGKGPTGIPLAKGILSKSDITQLGKAYNINMTATGGGQLVLTPGTKYVLLGTQNPRTIDDALTQNVHYRWPTSNNTNVVGEQYGKVNSTTISNITSYAPENLGTGWLKIHTDKDQGNTATIDYSWTPAAGGFGVGHQGEENRYQTFTMPKDSVFDVIDGAIKGVTGWQTGEVAENTLTTTFNATKTVKNINIFFEEGKVPAALLITAGATTLVDTTNLTAGFNSFNVPETTTDTMTFKVTSQTGGTVMIKEIEVMAVEGTVVPPTPTPSPTVTVTPSPTVTVTPSPTVTVTPSPTVVPANVAINVAPNNVAYGTVTGGGSYAAGAKVTVVATPKDGYRFNGWLENNASVSTNYQYSFTVAEARTLTAEFVKIGTPSVTAVSANYCSDRISWKALSGVDTYEVWMSTSKTGKYTKIATVKGTSYYKSKLVTNKTYYFKVRAKVTTGSTVTYGSYSAIKSARPIPGKTILITAKKTSSTSIKLAWQAVRGRTKYEVFRATSKTGKFVKVGETTKNVFSNFQLMPGKTYYYKMRAYRMVGTKKVYGSYSAVVSART